MALETVICPVCHGSKKEPISFPARERTCDLGFVHKFPEVIKNKTTCRKCCGTGTITESNFGRQ